MPSWPGSTAITDPATPLLAGSPTRLTQSPAPSYIPQVVMTLRTRSVSTGSAATSPVHGLVPLLASVAAIAATSRPVTVSEHCRKYRSTAASGSDSTTPNERNMCPIARFRCPVAASEACTAASSSSSRPANREKDRRMRSNWSSGVSPATSDAAVMAPALIIGLRGRSVTGSRLISLNGSPDGSTSIFAATASSPRSASARA